MKLSAVVLDFIWCMKILILKLCWSRTVRILLCLNKGSVWCRYHGRDGLLPAGDSRFLALGSDPSGSRVGLCL